MCWVSAAPDRISFSRFGLNVKNLYFLGLAMRSLRLRMVDLLRAEALSWSAIAESGKLSASTLCEWKLEFIAKSSPNVMRGILNSFIIAHSLMLRENRILESITNSAGASDLMTTEQKAF
jgi:hypothetical protein